MLLKRDHRTVEKMSFIEDESIKIFLIVWFTILTLKSAETNQSMCLK